MVLSLGSIFLYVILMSDAITRTRKRGRPATGAISVHLRIEPSLVEAVDKWAAENEVETRPEAIRRLVEKSLVD